MSRSPGEGRADPVGLLWLFALANYAVLLAVCAGFVTREPQRASGAAAVWLAAVWLTYPFLYLLPAFALSAVAHRGLAGLLRRAEVRVAALVAWTPAVVLFAGVQLAVYADLRLHELYGFHLNGFVWNLLTTRGGLDSLGAGPRVMVEAAGLAALVLAGEALGLAALARIAPRSHLLAALRSRRVAIGFAGVLLALSLGERLAYAAAHLRDDSSVLAWSEALPLYQPLQLDSLARRFGIRVARSRTLRTGLGGSSLVYPQSPLAFRSDAPRWNVLVLCAESLRADALDPELMPATWRFAGRATRFTQHVSGGNGTRMGVFSLFYGLPGPYWFKFVDQSRGPVLVRALLDRGYQVRGWTSDKFSYPEFDRTVFADVDRSQLREGGAGEGWERDRAQVASLLEFLGQRDRAQPFFAYLFFESPHAPYRFPPETAIRTPYLDDLDYLRMDLERDIGKIRNRYWNSVRHLDTQLERLFAALEEQGLLDSTLVVVTGDHGEEFLEKGRWGHNSAFDEEQIRVPLLLYVPGRPPAVVERMTSHLDVPATLLGLLGVQNPPRDYSLGQSLLDGAPHDYVLVSDWSRVAYVDADGKATFPMEPQSWFRQEVTDRRDAPLPDPDDWLRARGPTFARVLSDLARFTRAAHVADAGASGR